MPPCTVVSIPSMLSSTSLLQAACNSHEDHKCRFYATSIFLAGVVLTDEQSMPTRSAYTLYSGFANPANRADVVTLNTPRTWVSAMKHTLLQAAIALARSLLDGQQRNMCVHVCTDSEWLCETWDTLSRWQRTSWPEAARQVSNSNVNIEARRKIGNARSRDAESDSTDDTDESSFVARLSVAERFALAATLQPTPKSAPRSRRVSRVGHILDPAQTFPARRKSAVNLSATPETEVDRATPVTKTAASAADQRLLATLRELPDILAPLDTLGLLILRLQRQPLSIHLYPVDRAANPALPAAREALQAAEQVKAFLRPSRARANCLDGSKRASNGSKSQYRPSIPVSPPVAKSSNSSSSSGYTTPVSEMPTSVFVKSPSVKSSSPSSSNVRSDTNGNTASTSLQGDVIAALYLHVGRNGGEEERNSMAAGSPCSSSARGVLTTPNVGGSSPSSTVSSAQPQRPATASTARSKPATSQQYRRRYTADGADGHTLNDTAPTTPVSPTPKSVPSAPSATVQDIKRTNYSRPSRFSKDSTSLPDTATQNAGEGAKVQLSLVHTVKRVPIPALSGGSPATPDQSEQEHFSFIRRWRNRLLSRV